MTREEKLYSMRMQDLVNVADKLGVKINVKAAKSKAIETILAAEEMNKQNEKELKKEEAEIKPENIKTQNDFLNAVNDILDGKAVVKPIEAPINTAEEPKTNETSAKTDKAPKKANLKLSELTYKGETKSIKEWAAEKNMPWPTLYDRVNRNGWPIDLAIETPLGQRRPKNKEA